MKTTDECKKHLRQMGFKLKEVNSNVFTFTCEKALQILVADLIVQENNTANYSIKVVNRYN